MTESVPEVVHFPPHPNQIFSLPLTGMVEVESSYLETPTQATPEEKIDTFMEACAPDLVAVEKAWRNLDTAKGVYEKYVALDTQTIEDRPLVRAERRKISRNPLIRNLRDTGQTYVTLQIGAREKYASLREDLDPTQTLASQQTTFVHALQEHYTEAVEGARQSVEEYGQREKLHPGFIGFLKGATDIQMPIAIATTYAHFRDEIALRRIATFLEDDEVVLPFMQRIRQLTESSERSPTEQQLLELLATSNKEGSFNVLSDAIRGAAPKPATYAPDLMRAIMEGVEKPAPEIAGIAGALALAAEVVQAHTGLTQSDFARLYTEHLQGWTPELQTHLVRMANSRIKNENLKIQEVLESFIVKERLPAHGDVVEDSEAEAVLGPITPQKRRRTAGQASRPEATNIPAKSSNAEERERKQEPITHFAILQKTGTKGGNKGQPCTLTPVETIEEVFAFAELDDYIEAHREDQTVRPMLEAAIKHLTTVDPKDPIFTRPYTDVLYRVPDADIEARIPRRFKPSTFPGIKKGNVTRATRLIYDILTYEGRPTLVVYGAFLRGDLEELERGQLPRRRK